MLQGIDAAEVFAAAGAAVPVGAVAVAVACILCLSGSSRVARELSLLMEGRVRIEDSGLNWKILCGDAQKSDMDYLAWQSDQDAYALSG